MNFTTETILWAVSITLALMGITFGIIASRNSAAANKSLKELISNSIIIEETQKLFFDGLKSSISESKKAIKVLKSEVTYYDYSVISSNSRMHPIAPRVVAAFKTTEYKDISQTYIDNKKFLEKEYSNIIKDFSILKTDKVIPASKKESLIAYHTHLIDSATIIIKNYTMLTSTLMLKLK